MSMDWYSKIDKYITEDVPVHGGSLPIEGFTQSELNQCNRPFRVGVGSFGW